MTSLETPPNRPLRVGVKKHPINLRSLDVLRGLLAVYVVLGHCRWLLWSGHAEWLRQPHAAWEVPLAYASASLRFGHEAVMIFFVLSGFFIHLRAAERLTQGKGVGFSARGFYQRRAHRLVAPYLLALGVTVLCDAVGGAYFPRLYDAATGDMLLDQSFALKEYTAQSVLPALVLLPSSLGRDFGSNGPLWSLGYEVIYYALYPLWLAVRQRHAVLAFGLIPASSLALAFIAQSFPVNVLVHYSIWLAGAALAEILVVRPLSAKMAVGTALVFCAGVILHLFGHSLVLTVLAAVIFGSAAVCCFAALPVRLCQWKLAAAVEYLGVRSYTLYIVHFPIVTLLAAWVIHAHGMRPLHGWLAVIGAVLAIGLGCLCFAICERHFLHPRLRVKRLQG